ncbi:MAG: glutathione S-transferase family protein [Parvularculaceae bacterium]|nr:glutathione S-transferase family protein [Parvularculaceae bacterium]
MALEGVEKLRLHHCPATRSVRAKWALHETVGDAFEVAIVNLYAGDQFHPDYVAKNPSHNVPLLEVTFSNGETLFMRESAAIVAWLADTFPEKHLAPPADDVRARADYLQILNYGASPMDMMLWQIRVHDDLLAASLRDERTSARYRGKFRTEVEPQLTARLEKGRFICGDEFTAADIVIGYNIGWASAYGLCASEIFGRYRSELMKRPAFLAAFADAAKFSVKPPAPIDENSPFNG